MRVWLVERYGEPEDMVFAERPEPVPGPGEALIRQRACGLNFFDILQIQGKYQARPSFPFTVGAEVSGEIAALGPGVEGLRVGDRVLALPDGGGYAEASVARADRIFAIPQGMSFEQAAAFPLVYQTSWFGLHDRGRLQPGETVLVHAGASGVGAAAIQIARAHGVRVVASAGSEAKRAFCRELGAEDVIDYLQPDWPERVKALTGGRGADVIYDPVGGDVFDQSTKCIAPGGRLLVIGFTSGRIPTIAANRALLKNMSVVGVFWGRERDETPGFVAETHRRLTELWEAGKIRPPVQRTFPLEQASQALAELAGRRVCGKLALTM
ncbi:MAG: zinc-binding dehydrogenase [Acidobacteria bacterium]|nr:zinc-binding dehydrogenase [Acidobacteriota bacterium]